MCSKQISSTNPSTQIPLSVSLFSSSAYLPPQHCLSPFVDLGLGFLEKNCLFSLGEHYTAFSFFLRVWKRDRKPVCCCSITDTLGAPEDSLVPTHTGQGKLSSDHA